MNNNAISSKSISLKSKMNLDIKMYAYSISYVFSNIFIGTYNISICTGFLDKDGVFVGLQNFQEYLASESLLNSLKIQYLFQLYQL